MHVSPYVCRSMSVHRLHVTRVCVRARERARSRARALLHARVRATSVECL